MVVPGELDHDVFTTKRRQLLGADRRMVQIACQPTPERESQQSEPGGDGAAYGPEARVALADVMEKGGLGEVTTVRHCAEYRMC